MMEKKITTITTTTTRLDVLRYLYYTALHHVV